MAEPLTRVEIAFYPEFVNHWLRFGEADEWQDLDRRRALAFFRSGRVLRLSRVSGAWFTLVQVFPWWGLCSFC